jgi:hypothetical protein
MKASRCSPQHVNISQHKLQRASLRHLSEQYFTSSQTFAHFFRQENGLPQAAQSLPIKLAPNCTEVTVRNDK